MILYTSLVFFLSLSFLGIADQLRGIKMMLYKAFDQKLFTAFKLYNTHCYKYYVRGRKPSVIAFDFRRLQSFFYVFFAFISSHILISLSATSVLQLHFWVHLDFTRA